jgi:hypothetical protein
LGWFSFKCGILFMVEYDNLICRYRQWELWLSMKTLIVGVDNEDSRSLQSRWKLLSWLQCKSHIVNEEKNFNEIILIGEVSHCLENWKLGELHAIYRDLKFLVSTHKVIVFENTLNLYLCIYVLYQQLISKLYRNHKGVI